MFIVFQTIPILVENPQPVGFGGDPIHVSKCTADHSLLYFWYSDPRQV